MQEPMNPVYEKALDVIWTSINGGISHPYDLGKVVDMFKHLLNANETVEYVDQIQNYLKTKYKASDRYTQDITMVYEILLELKKGQSYWSDDLIQKILKT
jgi:hypothetical protein